jgi:hypothetical protein
MTEKGSSLLTRLIFVVAIGAIIGWKLEHPYTSFGCDGWGEYRKSAR